MFDPAALAALAEVLRRGSFEAAAAALHVTPSAVSQRIKALEERAGAVLVLRGQPCTGTEAGLRLARHHERIALLERGLARDLGRRPGGATLRIAVNADSLASWFLPALAGLDGLLFDLVLDDQDHSEALLRRGEVLAAVTAHPGPVAGCDSAPLGTLRYLATASPGYAAHWFPEGVGAAALAAAPAITFNAKDRLQSDWAARIAGRRVPLRTHLIPSSQGFVDAALAGIGWGMNPEPLIAGHLAAGRLVSLRPDAPLDVALHWQWARGMAGALAPVTRAVRAAARAGLLPP